MHKDTDCVRLPTGSICLGCFKNKVCKICPEIIKEHIIANVVANQV